MFITLFITLRKKSAKKFFYLRNFGYVYTINPINMIDHTEFPKAMLAGRARLTITNPASGQWVKLRMRQRKDKRTGQPGPCYFLSLALLGDGDLSYRYVGAYFADSGRFAPGRDSTAREREIAAFLTRAISQPGLLQRAEIEHAGQCLRCGRTLTQPDSIRSGYGPECFTIVTGQPANPFIRQNIDQLSDYGLI